MEDIKIINGRPNGAIKPPPSKSLSHRAIICASLAGVDWREYVSPIGDSDDIAATASIIEKLRQKAGGEVDCGESGSTLRFMLPVAALYGKRTIFTVHGRLYDRPLEPYMDVFSYSGVTLEKLGNGQIAIEGMLKPGAYRVPGHISSQFVTGLLLVLPLLSGDSTIELTTPLESKAYVDMTLDVMRHFGVSISNEDYKLFGIKGSRAYIPARYYVEPDYSQAAFFLASAALGCDVTCEGLRTDSGQGDRRIVDIISTMTVNGRLEAFDVDVSEIPDLFPVIAVLCSLADGQSKITGGKRLRFKESDRLSAMASELGKLGASLREGEDYLIIDGIPELRGGKVSSHGDHRIAMAMAVASLKCESPVELSGASCVSKSYPNFWNDFEKVR